MALNHEISDRQYRFLGTLALSYTCVLLMANWYDARVITIFGFITDSGTIIFPLTYIFSDVITEVYGYKQARRCIRIGFLINIVFIIYGQLIVHLPSPEIPAVRATNAMFDAINNKGIWIISGSIISYMLAEPLNSIIMAKLKEKSRGKAMAMRFMLSTVCASFLDCLVFSVIAFSNTMSLHEMPTFILDMWVIKVMIEACMVLFSVKLAKRLKKLEQTDMYDTNTAFNIFSFDTTYHHSDNKYQRVKL